MPADPDRNAFLRAVIADPGNDVPRLVFADWLDEHGGQRWAEFIRAQCKVAQLLRQVNRMGQEIGRAVEKFGDVEFDRGFIVAVECHWQEWVDNAILTCATMPIEHVTLNDWPVVEGLVPANARDAKALLSRLYPGIQFRLPRRPESFA